jgi:acyl-CoA synthetase (AMP-forming)/AMP-acid ligase II
MESEHHIPSTSLPGLSLISGPTSPPLVHHTLGTLLDVQTSSRPSHSAIICPTFSTTWSYTQLRSESLAIAKGLLALDVRPGDRIGILAENCAEYVAVFFSSGYVGATLVVLNNTYTVQEAKNALRHSGLQLHSL